MNEEEIAALIDDLKEVRNMTHDDKTMFSRICQRSDNLDADDIENLQELGYSYL